MYLLILFCSNFLSENYIIVNSDFRRTTTSLVLKAETFTFVITIQVTDTPGLCDTHRPEEEVLREVAKSVAIAGPGPHVVLLVFRCDRRFTAVGL